jgi:hypothetical protein
MSDDVLYQTPLLLFVRTNYVSMLIESLAFGKRIMHWYIMGGLPFPSFQARISASQQHWSTLLHIAAV